MSFGILDLYYSKSEEDVVVEYKLLCSTGKINSVDSDLRMVLIMNSLKIAPDAFTSTEIAIMNLITNLRINNIHFTFKTIYPLLKESFHTSVEDQRDVNLFSISKNVNLGLIPNTTRPDLSPPVKNYKTINYSSPEFGDIGRESVNVYCEWK